MLEKVTISIIIPVYNEEKYLRTLLDQLIILHSAEIILVDGGSTDDTYQIAKSFPKVKVLLSEKGRAAQMNLGAKEATSNILLFIHADSCLGPKALQYITDAFLEPHVLAGSFYLKFDQDSLWLNIYSHFSRINHSLFTYGDQGLFIRKENFEALGGFKKMALLEDLEIQKRIRKSGRFVKLPYPIVTSARRFKKEGIIWQQIKNIVIVSLYLAGVSASSLAKYYKIGIR